MKHKTVTGSSNVASYGYDPETRCLEVIFKGGGHYCAEGVEQAEYDALDGAESKGKHFHAALKSKHTFKKMEAK